MSTGKKLDLDGLTGEPALVIALASGMRQKDAAAASGISVRTIRDRMKDAEFRQQVEAGRDEIVDAGIGALASKMEDAVDVLHDIATSSGKNDNARVQAARAVLDVLTKLREQRSIDKLADRLATLETEVSAQRQAAAEAELAAQASGVVPLRKTAPRRAARG